MKDTGMERLRVGMERLEECQVIVQLLHRKSGKPRQVRICKCGQWSDSLVRERDLWDL